MVQLHQAGTDHWDKNGSNSWRILTLRYRLHSNWLGWRKYWFSLIKIARRKWSIASLTRVQLVSSLSKTSLCKTENWSVFWLTLGKWLTIKDKLLTKEMNYLLNVLELQIPRLLTVCCLSINKMFTRTSVICSARKPWSTKEINCLMLHLLICSRRSKV